MAILAGVTPSESDKLRHSALASEKLTNQPSWKRFKIRGKLVLITNRKSYMSFRLVPKSVTLNDLERCNGRYTVHCVISLNLVNLRCRERSGGIYARVYCIFSACSVVVKKVHVRYLIS